MNDYMKTAALLPGREVLITGLGPVGLGAIITCKYRGAEVIGVTRNQYRTNLAHELGADHVLDPADPELSSKIGIITNGLGADKTIECSGGEMYQRISLDETRRKGQVVFVGESDDCTIQVSDDLIRNGISLHGSWHWNLEDTNELMRTISNSLTKINKLITHTFPLGKVEDAFNLQMTGECGKVILHPQE